MFNQKSSTNWKDAVKEIQEAKKEIHRKEQIMTDYERDLYGRTVKDKVHQKYGMILKGVAEELENTISKYKTAKASTSTAIAKEINTWEAGKLQSELNLAQSRFGMITTGPSTNAFGGGPGIVDAARKIYQEAVASGDRYKIRAAAEALQGSAAIHWKGKDAVGMQQLSQEAKENLDNLRFTDEIKAAGDRETAAAQELLNTCQTVWEVGALMGDVTTGAFLIGNFVTLAKRVQVDRVTGKINIYDPDDPEVTGITITGPNIESIGGEGNE